MENKRRKFNGSFKAKVALAAVKGDRTMGELAGAFGVHPEPDHEVEAAVVGRSAEDFLRGASGRPSPAGGLDRSVVPADRSVEGRAGLVEKKIWS